MSRLNFRDAKAADLPFILALYIEDEIVPTGDDPAQGTTQPYLDALAAIDADPNQMLMVVELAGERVGTIQLTFVPGIAGHGAWRALIEAVHIAAAHRNRGLGSEMISWAVEQSRARNCRLVQLTSNKKRVAAHRFYERLGFVKSHEGFKLRF